jgi:hypothetical protein
MNIHGVEVKGVTTSVQRVNRSSIPDAKITTPCILKRHPVDNNLVGWIFCSLSEGVQHTELL